MTNDQRGAAEAVFMNFRKTNMPYSICRYILGNVLISINNVLMSFFMDIFSCSINTYYLNKYGY